MEYATTVLIILLVTLVIRHVTSLSKEKTGIPTDGTLVLKYPGFMAAIGYFAMGFGVLIGIVTIFQIVPTTGNEVVPYLVAFFQVLGLPLVWIERRVRAHVSGEKVLYTGLIKKPQEIRWDQVRKVTFSFTSEIVLHSGNTRIKLNVILAGFQGFVELLKRKVEPALYQEALDKYEEVLKNMERR